MKEPISYRLRFRDSLKEKGYHNIWCNKREIKIKFIYKIKRGIMNSH